MSFSDDDDDDDVSSTGSYSSDEEYHLTTRNFSSSKGGGGAKEQDREAIVRKKLLESFYGTSILPQQSTSLGKDTSQTTTTTKEEEDHVLQQQQQAAEKDNDKKEDDLDSPDFVADKFTRQSIESKSVQELLETDESLAMDIRLLDSTMQTLVYENYSKFIDATDAIRSIGQIIHTSQGSLQTLKKSMDNIQQISQQMESNIQPVRDGVADKLRIYKLLQRLDAILKLPSTLKDYISKKQYRKAATSHITARSIFQQHSSTYESLKSIQLECHDILQQMILHLQQSLHYWTTGTSNTTNTTNTIIIEPPTSIPEILECAATLSLLLEQDDFTDIPFTKEDCPTLALKSSQRYLTRHFLIQATPTIDHTINNNNDSHNDNHDTTTTTTTTTHQVPQAFLNGILEVATLFTITFPSWSHKMGPFVMDLFGIFMGHVRMLLLEHSSSNSNTPSSSSSEEETKEEEILLSQLQVSVRDFVISVKSIPTIGDQLLDSSIFIHQTMELSQVMVQRKVSQQFTSLRRQVLQHCFIPFFTSDHPQPTSSLVDRIQMANVSLLMDTLQYMDDTIRSIFLLTSDFYDSRVVQEAVQTSCRQFAFWFASLFETISGYPQHHNTKNSSSSSSSFDIMVLSSNHDNHTSSDEHHPNHEDDEDDDDDEASHHSNVEPLIPTIDLYPDTNDYDMEEEEDGMSFYHSSHNHHHHHSNNNNNSMNWKDSEESEEDALLWEQLWISIQQETICWKLAFSELCRLAEQSVGPSILQSLHACTEKQTKATLHASQFFASTTTTTTTTTTTQQHPLYLGAISKRFQQAASRCLHLYTLTQGNLAAEYACSTYYSIQPEEQEEDLPKEPTAWKVLQVAKTVSLECAQVFGCERMASKVSPFPDKEDRRILLVGQQQQQQQSLQSVTMKGLQMDVERMFMDQVQIYPNVDETMSFTRNKVVWIVLKIAFKAMMEQSRHAFFDTYTYRQMQINVEFMKHILPHYVQSEEEETLRNLLNCAMISIGERCIHNPMDEEEEEDHHHNDDSFDPISICDEFMKRHQTQAENKSEDDDEESILDKFIITPIQDG